MKVTKVYTKTGDKGTTALVGGIRVSKADPRIEAYGTVDELSAQLGLLASFMNDGDDREFIYDIQRNLFTVCSYLATDYQKTPNIPPFTLDATEVENIEQMIDKTLSELPKQTAFILSGGTHAAALAHVCRTICRRAERRIIQLAETVELEPTTLQYINRLSDYLFVIARKLNFIDNVIEKTWQKSCK